MPFIEVDVTPNSNTAWTVAKMFEAQSAPREITRVHTLRPNGAVGDCLVTGWSQEGPVPAYAAHVGDSGEGVLLLVYGGSAGIRLKPADSIEPWDLASSNQWGEPCLLLAHDASVG